MLSSVSELGLRKTPRSTYSSAAGADPAAELQATGKVGKSSYCRSWESFLQKWEKWDGGEKRVVIGYKWSLLYFNLYPLPLFLSAYIY